MTQAELQGSNSHCTLACLELDNTKECLENASKKQETGSPKVKAHWITGPNLKETWEKEVIAAWERAQETVDKVQSKAVEVSERNCQITKAAASKVFESQNSYKLKEDLQILACALQVSKDGTNAKITEKIKMHLIAHPDLSQNPRFAGLFTLRQ
ncbi:hypothetical protein B0H34DRAFT_794785 [Crassisporium funariophilum]|nr:hypothetical protein B0H34DRAFT_794785 [Crassisporium funariophilum]